VKKLRLFILVLGLSLTSIAIAQDYSVAHVHLSCLNMEKYKVYPCTMKIIRPLTKI
jgi:hypothetical protein